MTAPHILKADVPAHLKKEAKRYDVVVCGGGMSGVGAAMTAARHGAKCALIQDRPVLGGNGSKEIRVWLQGARGGVNNLWFRETGLMEELLLENQYRNPEGNAEIWDTVILDLVLNQPNLDLFLNTTVVEVAAEGGRIRSVTAATLQAETLTVFEAPYFVDCTGDGTIGYLAGAEYMTGREARSEFGEWLAPEKRQGYTLGGSILFLSKDAGHPVPFVAPSFAHKFTKKDFRPGRDPIGDFERIGGGYWWIEWGGTLDTIHDNEAIKFELLKIAYGIFDYLKNDPEHGGKYANRTLEWVGTIPGKRESRRLLGDHILTQQDVEERTEFPDGVAFAGWNLDDHARLGFFDDVEPPSTHTHQPGMYNVPLRSLYSRNVANLFMAGRNVSATHVALTSVRVMLTCAQMGEAAGAAAAQCAREGMTPRELARDAERIERLRERLLRDDHYIVNCRRADPADLCLREGAKATASSQLGRAALEVPDREYPMHLDRMVLLPAPQGKLEYVEVLLSVKADTQLGWQLHQADGRGRYLPAQTLDEGAMRLKAGDEQWVRVPLKAQLSERDWVMLELKKNPEVSWHGSSQRLVGVRGYGEAPPTKRRENNKWTRFRKLNEFQSYCVRLPADQSAYAPDNAINGWPRPFQAPNLWISRETDFEQPEWLEVAFAKPAKVGEVHVLFDSDLDRHLTNTWVLAPYRIEPDLVKEYEIEARVNGVWEKAAQVTDNHQRFRRHVLKGPMEADAVRVVVRKTNGTPQARVYEVRAFEA